MRAGRLSDGGFGLTPGRPLPAATRLWLVLAGINGALAVAAGAYGWHGLGGDDMFEIAANYQVFHALALIGVAWLAAIAGGRGRVLVNIAGTAFTVGIVLFSGSLYSLVLLGDVPVRGAAPIGGALLMGGWVIVACSGLTVFRKPAAG